jgi:hypothetical protein
VAVGLLPAFGLYFVEATSELTFVTARCLAHHPEDGFVSWLHPLRFLHGYNPSYGVSNFPPWDCLPLNMPPFAERTLVKTLVGLSERARTEPQGPVMDS